MPTGVLFKRASFSSRMARSHPTHPLSFFYFQSNIQWKFLINPEVTVFVAMSHIILNISNYYISNIQINIQNFLRYDRMFTTVHQEII